MSEFRIKLEAYGSWLVVNCLMGLLPILVTLLFPNAVKAQLISSFLAFCFTLLITSLYVYYFDIRYHSEYRSDLMFWLSIVFLLLIWGSYIFYNIEAAVKDFVDKHSILLPIFLGISVAALGAFLNYKRIEKHVYFIVQKKLQAQSDDELKAMKENLEKGFAKLRKEDEAL